MAREDGARKLVLQMGVSLDGMVAVSDRDRSRPVMGGSWGLPPEDPRLTALKLQWLSQTGAHLMGRVTYEQMAQAWPTSSHDYAAPMNELPKIVFSRTLERADWAPSQIATGDLVDEIARLRAEPGKDLVAWGGAAFAQSLARADVVDEYRFTVHPVAVGDCGLRVFADLPTPLAMELVDEQTFTSASVRIFRRLI